MATLKVLHISTHGYNVGGAIATYRLHQGLQLIGIPSKMLCLYNTHTKDDTIRFSVNTNFINRLKNRIYYKSIKSDYKPYRHTKPADAQPLAHVHTAFRVDLAQQVAEADIIHLHEISHFVDLPSFFREVKKPVVWTFHQMNSFTGGCHYDFGCGRYTSFCGSCPKLGSDNMNDLSRKIYIKKRDTVQSVNPDRLKIFADSYWLAEAAKQSRIFDGRSIGTIHYGLDHNLYRPRDKMSIKNLLGIPPDKNVILFGAMGVNDVRKGFHVLKEALNLYRESNPDIMLLSFGKGECEIEQNFNHLHLGNIQNEHFLSWVYNAADVFVIPSLQEAFGQTCLEAMACGVPCAGFDTGGIPDMIKNNETGFLAETGNPVALAEAIRNVLAKKEILGANARKSVEEKFTLQHQAINYLRVYEEMV